MKTFSKAQVKKLLKSSPKKEAVNQITFWYGGQSLFDLRKMKPELFYNQSWSDNEAFVKETHPEGMYTVTFRVPESNSKTFGAQIAQLPEGEEICPVAILAMAALLLFVETGNDPFEDDWSRCCEQTADGYRVGLRWGGGRLDGSRWDDDRYDRVWSSSVRTSDA